MLEAVLIDALRSALGPIGAVYALLAIGLNIHFGYTGLLNFGQVGFMLLGAYGVAITVSTFGGPLWLGVIVGLLLGVALAVAMGVPTLRLRADYLAITTIAAAESLRFIFRASVSRPLTGGSFGLRDFAGGFYAINPVPPGAYSFGLFAVDHRRLWAMIVGWVLVALTSLLVWALMRSPWGRVLKSIRDDEDAARSLGKNVFSYKMQSLILGGVVGAFAGVFYVMYIQTVQPDVFRPQVTFYAYAVLILGGAARVLGPVAGAFIFWAFLSGVDSLLRRAAESGALPEAVFTTEALGAVRLMLVGALIVLLMIYRPQGVFGNRREMQLNV